MSIFSIFYFDPGVIWGRFRHPKSIFDIDKSKFYEKMNLFLTPKSIFSIKKKEPEPNKKQKKNNLNFRRKLSS